MINHYLNISLLEKHQINIETKQNVIKLYIYYYYFFKILSIIRPLHILCIIPYQMNKDHINTIILNLNITFLVLFDYF